MNQARNAQQNAGQYNQILANQAMQQQGMFQNTLPLYNRALDFYSRRAGFGMYEPDNSFLNQQQQFQQPAQWKPTEIGGAKYHGLSDRLRGKGDGNAEMYGQGDINGRVRGMRPNTGAVQPGAAPAGIGAPPVAPGPQMANSLGQQGWGSRRTMGQPMPAGPASMNRTGGVSDQQMGIWNNPEDRLRMARAQDDIDRYQGLQNKQLLHQLGQRGLAESSVYGGGLEKLSENALQNFANFRRNQAIGAGQEEERRVQNLLNSLAPGMGFGSQSAGTFGQLGQQQSQQAAQSQQALQQLFQVFGQLFSPQPGAPGWQGGTQNTGPYNGGLGGIR